MYIIIGTNPGEHARLVNRSVYTTRGVYEGNTFHQFVDD